MAQKQKRSRSQVARFFEPVIRAIQQLGGSARPTEVKEHILRNVQLAPGYLELMNQSGESKFSNQVDWARFYLDRAGYIKSSERGVWTLTDRGRIAEITDDKEMEIIREVAAASRKNGTTLLASDNPDEIESSRPPDRPQDYKAKTLDVLKRLSPGGFESLCQRLLRESGFEEVTVTGRSGDEGIDGQGILQLNPFVSFRVLFQCKRWAHSVGPNVVRDFRGAMVGRAEKGIIITTSFFTPQAETEATRDGAQPIELVDGQTMVELLAKLRLGLAPVESYEIEAEFFEQYK